MSYTQFPTPEVRQGHNVMDWVTWLRENGIVRDFLPAASNVCDLCGKPCGARDDGEKWPLCYNCQGYAAYIDALVVGSYSFYAGLESLVGTYKDNVGPDGRPVSWKRLPLSAILWAVLYKHKSCIDRVLGADPIYTWVPSDNQSRGFDHVEEIIKGVKGQWEAHPWVAGVVTRNRSYPRPDRNHVNRLSYRVNTEVSGRGILLLDDLWTTGGSMVSAAAALKDAGASAVVGLVLGRQVNPSLAGHDALAAEVADREWKLNECSLCA